PRSAVGSASSASCCRASGRYATCSDDRRYLQHAVMGAQTPGRRRMNDDKQDGSLDPQDWTALRALAHRAVDDSFDQLVSVRDRPIWQATPDSIVAKFQQPLPREPQGAEAAYG